MQRTRSHFESSPTAQIAKSPMLVVAEEAGEAAEGVQMEVVEMVGVAEGGPKRRRNA